MKFYSLCGNMFSFSFTKLVLKLISEYFVYFGRRKFRPQHVVMNIT